MTNRTVTDIHAVVITLNIASKQALFVLAARDGTVNRMGSGTLEAADGALYIGTSRPPLLPRVLQNLSDSMLRSTGGYEIPNKRGVPCNLSIALSFAGGAEDGFGYTYGSESRGPPRNIVLFVHGAMVATQSWYQEQRRIAGKPPASPLLPPRVPPWWRFW